MKILKRFTGEVWQWMVANRGTVSAVAVGCAVAVVLNVLLLRPTRTYVSEPDKQSFTFKEQVLNTRYLIRNVRQMNRWVLELQGKAGVEPMPVLELVPESDIKNNIDLAVLQLTRQIDHIFIAVRQLRERAHANSGMDSRDGDDGSS